MIRRILGVVFVVAILVGLGFAARFLDIGGSGTSMDITDISTSTETTTDGATQQTEQSVTDPIPPLPSDVAESVPPQPATDSQYKQHG